MLREVRIPIGSIFFAARSCVARPDSKSRRRGGVVHRRGLVRCRATGTGWVKSPRGARRRPPLTRYNYPRSRTRRRGVCRPGRLRQYGRRFGAARSPTRPSPPRPSAAARPTPLARSAVLVRRRRAATIVPRVVEVDAWSSERAEREQRRVISHKNPVRRARGSCAVVVRRRRSRSEETENGPQSHPRPRIAWRLRGKGSLFRGDADAVRNSLPAWRRLRRARTDQSSGR